MERKKDRYSLDGKQTERGMWKGLVRCEGEGRKLGRYVEQETGRRKRLHENGGRGKNTWKGCKGSEGKDIKWEVEGRKETG